MTIRHSLKQKILLHKRALAIGFSLFLCFTGFSFFLFRRTSTTHTTNNLYNSKEASCKLCNNGEPIYKIHTNLYGSKTKESNILMNTESFYVAIDNYPVFPDHILIIPKKHYVSFSTLEDTLANELDAIIDTLTEFTRTKNFGLFEHGSNMVGGEQKLCGNSIYHAHLHFIPNLELNKKNFEKLLGFDKKQPILRIKHSSSIDHYVFTKRQDQTFLNFIKTLPTIGPYLFCYYSNVSKEAFCVPDQDLEGGVPSQFFRKMFAEYFQADLKTVFWNWKDPQALELSKNFRETSVLGTIEKVKSMINIDLFNSVSGLKTMHPCLFCNPSKHKVLIDGNLAYVATDAYPVTKDHSLIITKRHFASFFDITDEELIEVKHLLCKRKAEIVKNDPEVMGFNIGVNIGEVSGQSIFHLHVHLIPRRFGDIENPRGGIRGIIPEKRDYFIKDER